MLKWNVQISGLGKYLPKNRVHHQQIENELGLKSNAVKESSGVVYRHRASIEDGETTVKMATKAATEAIANAHIKPENIDLIIHCSAIPEQALPDTGALIQAELGLGHTGVQCQSIHMSCLGFVAAIEQAGLYISSGKKNCVLIVCAELASVGLNPKDPKTYGLFGDGAAAAILTPTPVQDDSQIMVTHFETHSDHAHGAEIRGGGTRRHPNTFLCEPEDNYFTMNGPVLLRGSLRYAKRAVAPFITALANGIADIDLIIPHQPSKTGMQAMQKIFPANKMHVTLEQLGNCISASIPLTLIAARDSGCFDRGDTLLLIGTGAGLTIGGVLIKW